MAQPLPRRVPEKKAVPVRACRKGNVRGGAAVRPVYFGAADTDRGIGSRGSGESAESYPNDNTRAAQARITARNWTADLRRAGQCSAVRASDCTEFGMPVATEHPVNTETIKSMTIRLRQWDASSRLPPSSCVRPRRVAPSPPTAWHRAYHRALRCGRPTYAGQSRRQHGSGEHPCTLRRFPAASFRLPGQAHDR